MGTSLSYRSLNNEQKTVLRTKTITAKKTPAEWLTFLRPIAAYDRKRDTVSRWAMRLAIAGGILTFFSLIFFGASGMTVGGQPLFFGALGLIFGTFLYKRLKKLNIEADLEKLLVPLLHILKEELHPNEKLQLQLNLHDLEQTKPVRESRPKTKTAYPLIIAQLFRNQWLNGVTQLADGTALRMQITDLVRKIERTNRNSRGKIKTKRKYKQQSRLSLALGFRSDSYTLKTVPSPPQKNGRVAVQSRDTRHWVKIRRRVKFPPRLTTTPDSIPLDQFVGSIAAAFQQVTPIRKAQ